MKDQIASLLRHAFTALAGMGVFFFAKGWIDQADVSQVDLAGSALASSLVVILTAVISRLLMTLMAKIFRSGAGEDKTTRGGSGGSLPLWVLIGALAGFMGCLPACTPAQLAAARNFPIKACVVTDQGRVCYSANDGLSAEVDATSHK